MSVRSPLDMQHPGILEGDRLASLRLSEPDSAHWAASRGLLLKRAQPHRSETSLGVLAPCFLVSISRFPFLGSFVPCLLTSQSATEQREGVWPCNHKTVVVWRKGGTQTGSGAPQKQQGVQLEGDTQRAPPCAVCPQISSLVPQHSPHHPALNGCCTQP